MMPNKGKPTSFSTSSGVLSESFLTGSSSVGAAATVNLGAAFNAAGAIGDVWISTIVLRYAPTAWIVDERDGIRVYLPGPAA